MLIQCKKDKAADKSVKRLTDLGLALAVLGALAMAIILVPAGTGAAFKAGDPSEDSGGGFAAAGQEKSYLLSVDYGEEFGVSEIALMDAKAPDRSSQPETGFRCEVVSVNDEILETFKFDDPRVQCSDNFGASMEGGCVAKESGQFSMMVPYYETGSLINIYDAGDKMVLSADISDFAKLCGDGVCQENENYGTCPTDCRSGMNDGVCDRVKDGTCDPDCAKASDPDCASAASYTYLIAIAIVLVLAGIAGYFIWRRKKNDGNEPSEEE